MKATVSTKSVDESTVLNLSDPGHKEPEGNNTVLFKVSYSKDYKGQKHWEDGSVIETSAESASDFEKRGLGKLVKETRADAEKGEKPEEVNTDDEVKEEKGKKGKKG